MSRRLEMVRERKLFRLLPGRRESSRLEASGVALVDDRTALVVFDNLNQVARIDLSLRRSGRNALLPAPSLGSGFEDIAVDRKRRRVFCLVEAIEDFDGCLRGFVAEYDVTGRFIRCTRLHHRFEKENTGFEGLAHVWFRGRESLYALREGGAGRRGGAHIDVFVRAGRSGQRSGAERSGAPRRGLAALADGGWKPSHKVRLPQLRRFEDFSALAYRDRRVAIVSQESSRLWVARIDERARAIVRGSEAVYRFPSRAYGNVEGIAWLAPDTLVAVSDRRKRGQSKRCAKKDQSIHIFRIPEPEQRDGRTPRGRSS
ncbi:MAG TPA: hypothetical protein VFQ07_09550 [Candidatus Polarisedimenticolia bacterium]|nr:hypothetical protein [Candidatus Polarisedimenticolia bacterium]